MVNVTLYSKYYLSNLIQLCRTNKHLASHFEQRWLSSPDQIIDLGRVNGTTALTAKVTRFLTFVMFPTSPDKRSARRRVSDLKKKRSSLSRNGIAAALPALTPGDSDFPHRV